MKFPRLQPRDTKKSEELREQKNGLRRKVNEVRNVKMRRVGLREEVWEVEVVVILEPAFLSFHRLHEYFVFGDGDGDVPACLSRIFTLDIVSYTPAVTIF